MLLRVNKENQQRLVYSMSKPFIGVETWYTHIEQATFSWRVVAKILRPYFQAYPIIISTNLLLQATLDKLNLFGWIIKWAMELSEHGIQYKPRLSLKRQVLTKFIAKLPEIEAVEGSDGSSMGMGHEKHVSIKSLWMWNSSASKKN